MSQFRNVEKYLIALTLSILCGCSAVETHRAVSVEDTKSAADEFSGTKAKVVVGKVVNRSAYMTGVFSDGNDRLGAQATQMLVMHLSRANRFVVLDRQNMDVSEREAKLLKDKQKTEGGKFIISGVVTEFGRKESGSQGLAGIISRSKHQVLYAKVSVSVIDPISSRVLGTYAGAGEYELTSKQVLGFGSHAGYDGTLADKVLDLAMREAVDKIASGYDHKEF